jgi:PAS domain S-box-containing protein
VSDGIEDGPLEAADEYRLITEAASDAIVTIDADHTVRYANPAVERVFGYAPDELVGRSVDILFPDSVRTTGPSAIDRLMEHDVNGDDADLEFTGRHADGSEVEISVSIAAHEVDSDVRLTGFIRDVTDRKERERGLREAYQIVSEHGRSFEEQLGDLLEVGRRVVGTEYATLSRVRGDQYLFEAVVAPDDADLEAGDTVPLGSTNCERVVETQETLVLNDVASDAPELADRAGNAEWGISSYLGTPVFVDGEVYGTFCFYDTEARSTEFSEWDTAFVHLFSTWVGNELEQQRYVERLVALNELNDVVRAVSDAVLSESTRAEIEHRACQALADADSYLFAWVGEADPATQTVSLRAEAGVEGYLDDVTISVDADDPRSQGPTGRALQTAETQTVTSVDDDPRYAPWRDQGARYGYTSAAAVPISYEGNVFGVLNVYTDRENAFEGGELAVIDHLGDIIGHAIVAAERREVLLGDTVVELDLRIVDALANYGIHDAPDDEIRFDAIIPTGGDAFLVSGETTAAGLTFLEEIVAQSGQWQRLTVNDSPGPAVDFELAVTSPSQLTSLQSISGEFVAAAIEGTDLRVCVHLPKNVDVRRILDTVREVFPETNLVSKQEVTREHRTPRSTGEVDLDELTDKQLNSLRAAYMAGYFEWPRDASGKEVAAKLDIAPATFSQHLRAVERKVFGSLLDGEP